MTEATDDQKLKGGLGCGAVIAVLLLIGFVISLFDGDDGPDESSGPTADGAIRVCEQSVENKLKAPATADFNDEVANPGTEPSTFEVAGVVDAENGFGANIRTAWICTAIWVDGTEWNVSSTLAD